jgi:hypothetical protein
MVRRRVTPEARDAWARLFSGAFLELMNALTRAEPVEQAFARFRPTAKKKTKSELKRLADLAGRHIAERAGPEPSKLSEERLHALTVEALEFALGTPDNEDQN